MYKTLRAPLSAQIEITGKCNNKCVHCYNFWRKDKNDKIQQINMSSEQVKDVLRKFSDYGIFSATVTGGEPLLNKLGLTTFLEEAKFLNIETSVNSNLVCLNKKYLQELKRLGLQAFLTSILGPNAEVHDGITQTKGSFNALMKNIQLCLEDNIRISPNMVITRRNIAYIRQTAELIHSLGINTFFSTKAGCPGNCDDFSSLSISLEQFREYLEELYKTGIELKIKTGVLESYPLCGIKDADRYKAFTGRKCLAGVTTFTVASNGNVRPCSHLDVSYGNIFMEELGVIWERMKNWRNGTFLPINCKRCKLLTACGGGCRMEAQMVNGSFTSMDPYASTESVNFCSKTLENKNKIKVQNDNHADLKEFILRKDLKWRKESFGSVLAISKKSVVFLSHDGTKVWEQFEYGREYKMNDQRINWGNLDSQEFVLKLFKKGAILPTFNRREVT